jgi:hypothetical protein
LKSRISLLLVGVDIFYTIYSFSRYVFRFIGLCFFYVNREEAREKETMIIILNGVVYIKQKEKKKDCFYDGSSNCAFCLNNFKVLVMQTTSKTLLDDY